MIRGHSILVFLVGIGLALIVEGLLPHTALGLLPTVLVGVLRYASHGAYTDRQALTETVAPMSAGSLGGAVAGGLLVGVVPASLLKLGLGMILNVSAGRIFYRKRVP